MTLKGLYINRTNAFGGIYVRHGHPSSSFWKRALLQPLLNTSESSACTIPSPISDHRVMEIRSVLLIRCIDHETMGYLHFLVLGLGAVLCPDLLMMEPRGFALLVGPCQAHRGYLRTHLRGLSERDFFAQIAISAEHKLKLPYRPFVFPLNYKWHAYWSKKPKWMIELLLCDHDHYYSTQVFIVSNMDQFTIKRYSLCSTLQ